jgi:hypothetical protein
MKKILLSLIILNSIFCFSQENFTINEFNKITNNGEKWKSDIKIFLYGNYSYEDSLTVVRTIDGFNLLVETINITLVNNIDSSNTVIYFISDETYIKLFPSSEKVIKNSIGNTRNTYVYDKITKSRVHIDIVECNKYKCMSSTIIHEMFHILGFNHIEEEKNSILKGHTDNLTEKDKEMISLLYKK